MHLFTICVNFAPLFEKFSLAVNVFYLLDENFEV